MMRTVVFGGSFNPVHCGHIALAQSVLAQGLADEVWLMVSPQNPLKPQGGLLCDDDRMALARRAVADIDGVVASDYEFLLPRPSYTWNTLQQLQRNFPQRTFSLLVGGDNWALFQQWYHWKDILRHYNIIVYPRGGHTGTMQAPLLNVSSTDIRQRVARGESISGMVPHSIEADVVRLYSVTR